MPRKTPIFVVWLVIAVALFAAGADGKKGKVQPPKPIYMPDPEYTASARQDRIEGKVVVSINLDAEGIPHDIKVVRGLRSDLDEKAVEAVTRWRFHPAVKDGKQVPVSFEIELSFLLP